MAAGVTPVVRGCGVRRKGGVYLTLGLAKGGRPVEDFLLCPPVTIPVREWGITALGVKLLPDAEGVYHVFDVIGSEHYPNVADFIEEVRRFGLSRRVTSGLAFHLLTPKSRVMCLHARAYIENADDLWPRRHSFAEWQCPKNHPHHLDPALPPPMCSGLYWQTVEGLVGRCDTLGQRERVMPAFSYRALALQEMTDDLPPLPLRYRLAAFASFPIGRIDVIRDTPALDELHLRQAGQARGIPTALEEA